MKKTLLFLLGILFTSFSSFSQDDVQLIYEVNLNDRADDYFKVSLQTSGLQAENEIYQFASTAPGTYQVMDMGRYVRDFQAFDTNGRELGSTQVTTNQWKIDNIEQVTKITYKIAETWDTPVDEHEIYAMCGSSLEADHSLINGQTVFGYPTGMQNSPLKIKINYPTEWLVGTALSQDEDGYFLADDYDHIVDSPILLGRLTKADMDLNGAAIEIYSYSKTDKIQAEQLLSSMKTMLTAAGEFIVDFPVDRYTFLFHFENKDVGAWEHSYSSEYVMREGDFDAQFGKHITDIAAHEFFHVITPLNIHSEIIEDFNFVTPTPSQHLWLYEGTTEWAAHIMQLRYDGLYNLTDYLEVLSFKVMVAENYFDRYFSLKDLALTSYTPQGQKQYGNIYFKGALVAGLLDIRLLELSNGEMGLRELVNQLSQKYGKENAFPEEDFFEEVVNMTYPEIGDFFEKYIKNAEELPYEEYYAKVGIKAERIDVGKMSFEEDPNANKEATNLRQIWMSNL